MMGGDPVNVNFSVKGREAFDQRDEHVLGGRLSRVPAGPDCGLVVDLADANEVGCYLTHA